ncbi:MULTISPECIES: ABC transporter ATP-binding protein [Mucilaginibacter]|jgi:lipoprotein-releasing system ATP-binding protein|uniref:ABC transporter ATP-binding protein n=1 Tax=Mucilaginibacter aquariorum TaxID=2967225 RepID=A0ABT1T5D2_9SPHI|nr:ABC transporter ATP-binding protein [Mucilaginibacter aquariorum]MCQ6959153.1 ABC transporter ATP-binding protein [Mucilaginibacter aquariorum]
METPVLQAININKYFLDPVRFRVLKDISFSIGRGSFVSITGKSGCGKSTLLYILSTMDTDYEGELFLDNEALQEKDNAALALVRNQKIGFVFQFHYLIEEFNVLKNVMLPAMKLGKFSNEMIEQKAMQHLKTLGIYDQALKNASQLSGGQKQRVAIARALINDPLIIMGDEPTGNLDKKNSDIVFGIFKEICLENKQTTLVVTHDPDFAKRADRIIQMEDGKILL